MRSKQGLMFIFGIKIAYIIDDANYIEINHLINLTPSLARSCMQGHRPRAAIGRGGPPLAPGPCMTSLSIQPERSSIRWWGCQCLGMILMSEQILANPALSRFSHCGRNWRLIQSHIQVKNHRSQGDAAAGSYKPCNDVYTWYFV